MATYLQLQQEPAWGAEYAPPNLQAFYTGLRTYLGVGANAVGGKGDNNHLRGYHRSRRWILESRYSAYRQNDYSVTNPLDKGGDPNWLAALDATPKTTATLIAMCKRLDTAMRADTLPQVREWYGNVDGNKVVDGWDDVTHRAASSDSSHLWHLHISFYRSRANDDHSRLLAVLTGGDDMYDQYDRDRITDTWGKMAVLMGQVAALTAKMDTVLTAIGAIGTSNPDVAAILAGVDARVSKAEAEIRDAVADLGEGGAAQVRADT